MNNGNKRYSVVLFVLYLLGNSHLQADEMAIDSDLEQAIIEFQSSCIKAGGRPSEDDVRSIKRSLEAIAEKCTSEAITQDCTDRLGAILETAGVVSLRRIFAGEMAG